MSTETQDTEALTLADDLTGLVGPKRFGELVAEYQGRDTPYSDQSVRNWVEKGYLKPAGQNKRGKLYNPAHVPAVAANLPSTKHGGARRGSGRKKEQTNLAEAGPLGQRMDAVQRANDAVEAFEKRGETGDRIAAEEAVNIHELLGIKRVELDAVLKAFGTGKRGVSHAHVSLLKDIVELKSKDQKLAIQNGELIRKQDMIDAVKDTHRPVVEMLNQLPATLLTELSPWVWLSQNAINDIMSRVNAALSELGLDQTNETVKSMLDTLRADLNKPASLDATLRAMIDRATDHARRSLVGDMKEHTDEHH